MGQVIFPSGINQPISLGDSLSVSSFGRLRIEQGLLLFGNQQQYGDDTTVWETQYDAHPYGNITFLPNESTIQLSTGSTTSTASCIRQTRIYHRYTPGDGLLIDMTFAFDGGATVTNNSRKVGFFDANNGIYLEALGTTVSICQRTNISGTPSDANKIPQSSWSKDKFDGTGPSGKTINWANSQILLIDLQWLGVGRVRVGFNIDGVAYLAHEFKNANSIGTVYMTTANLPLRYENVNTGTASGTATLRHICSAVYAGGAAALGYGHQYAYNNGPSGLAITNGSTAPVISIQAATTGPNSVRNTGQIIIEQYDVAISSSNAIYWQLLLNPTLTGASFAAYSSGTSIANVDHSATTVSGGILLDSGLISGSATSKGSQLSQADIKQLILVYSGLLNHQDIMTLVCTAVNGNATAFCNFQWLEQW